MEGEEEYDENLNEEAIEEHQRQFDNMHEAQHSGSQAGIAEREEEPMEEKLPQNVSELGPRHSMQEPEQTSSQGQSSSSFAAATSNATHNTSNVQRAPSITATGMRIDTSVNISSPPPNRSASPGPLQQQHSGTSQSVPFASPRPPSGRNSPLLRSSSHQESPPPSLTREFSSNSSTGGRNPPTAPRSPTPEPLPRPSSPASTTATSPTARPFSLPVSALRSVSSFRSSLSQKPSFWKANSPPARSNSVASMRDMAASGKGLNVASPTDTSPGSSKGGAMVDMINTKEYFILSSMQAKTPAEIAEMKRDLDFCLKELQVASKRIESLEFHNAHLTDDVSFNFLLFLFLLNRSLCKLLFVFCGRLPFLFCRMYQQLARYKALYADSSRHERLLETQLEQYLLHSTVTAEFIEESMNDMIYVSNQISLNEPVPVSF